MCVDVYLSHTGGTRASIVLQLATCHGVIKAEQEEKRATKEDNSNTKCRAKTAGEERPSTGVERAQQGTYWLLKSSVKPGPIL